MGFCFGDRLIVIQRSITIVHLAGISCCYHNAKGIDGILRSCQGCSLTIGEFIPRNIHELVVTTMSIIYFGRVVNRLVFLANTCTVISACACICTIHKSGLHRRCQRTIIIIGEGIHLICKSNRICSCKFCTCSRIVGVFSIITIVDFFRAVIVFFQRIMRNRSHNRTFFNNTGIIHRIKVDTIFCNRMCSCIIGVSLIIVIIL